MQRLTTKDRKDPRFGTDREAIAEEVYGAPFAGLTQAQKAAVNARVEAEQGRKAEKGAAKLTNVLPGAKELIDIPKFRNTVQGSRSGLAGKAVNWPICSCRHSLRALSPAQAI